MNIYTQKELLEMIKYFKLKNQYVTIHSSLFTLGKIKDIPIKQINEFLLNLFEENFKVFFPTYNYDFPKTKFIDLTKANSQVGELTDYALKKGYFRTSTAMFSHCGNDKELIKENFIETNPFSNESFFHRFREKNGKFLIFGAKPFHLTYIIYTEFMNNVKYRFLKPFTGTIKTKHKPIKDTFFHFAFPLNGEIKHNYCKFHSYLIERNITKTFLLGKQKVYLIDANQFFDEISKYLKQNPYGLINTIPKQFYYWDDNLKQEIPYKEKI